MTPLPHTPARFVLISRWRLACQPHEVWQLLTQLEHWPSWWPYVRRVRVLHHPAQGVAGTRAELAWGSALGYGIKLHVLTTRSERGADGGGELEGKASGDLHGRGLWLVEPVSAQEVDVTYRWEVELHKPWMRRLTPLLRGAFAWNHFIVMRAGARGMAKRLGCEVSQLADWTGGPA